jgi:hypothetical protein
MFPIFMFKKISNLSTLILLTLYFTSVLLYFSSPSGSLMPALLRIENWIPLKPVLGSVRDVALYVIPHVQTQSSKVCSSLVILLWLMLRGITLFPDFILHNSRCQVLCGSCKKLPRTSLQCCLYYLIKK